MNLLAIVSGEYGYRHLENIQKYAPPGWVFNTWQAPVYFPWVIDEPGDHLPKHLPPSDLVLSFAEHKAVAELLPEIAARTEAKAVIVAVDNENWLPRGLERQLHGWLAALGVACATPRPLCSLTEQDYGITRRQRQTYQSELISSFATHFGRPSIDFQVDPASGRVLSAEVQRDAVCGCARAVAQGLVGVLEVELQEKASLLHHHYPCLASMVKLDDFDHETLMMESGRQLTQNLRKRT